MEDPLFRRIREHAKKRLEPVRAENRAQLTQPFKEFLRLENKMLRRYHRKGDSGLRVAQARAIVMDVLIENLFASALAQYSKIHPKAPCKVAILALGGYGRAELSPFSDVDLMFLFPNRVRSKHLPVFQQTLTDTMLYILWDLKFKVGHSTRSIRESIEEARKSMETKNALLEARRVVGSRKLHRDFRHAYGSYCQRDVPQEYIKNRLNSQEERRKRYGNTVYLQEPDIKNGVGGLRDYQNILWMARIKLDLKSIEELKEGEYLNRTEYRELTAAYEFLLWVRTELHIQSRRATDVLNLEKQPLVAWRLGYRTRDILKRVEVFMRDYYTHARNIDRVAKNLEQRLALLNNRRSLRDVIQSRRYQRRRRFDGFVLSGNQITFEREDIFAEDPDRLIRIFRHCQQYRADLEFELASLIRRAKLTLAHNLTDSASANRSFRSILQSVGEVYPALNRMHEQGVLENFMPEFASLTCLVQHEYYHRYTADIHTLHALRELDLVFTGNDRLQVKYSRALHETDNPSLLYLILLLHDIGKGISIQDHPNLGAEISEKVLERMQVEPALRGKILFIIKNHLEMARFWQHHDIDDPNAIRSFAGLVENEDNLRLLYVHTFCDVRATASGLWNDYKDMLHTRLFENTRQHLAGREQPDLSESASKIMTSKEFARGQLPDISEEEIEAHFNLLPERYFIHNSPEEIALHLRMVHELLTHISEADSLGSLAPTVEWKDDLSLSLSVVTIVTWDRSGLFYKLAGALSVAGLSIVSSKALSRTDHITIDTFYVCEVGGGAIQDKSALATFRKFLEEALVHDMDLMPHILAQAKRHQRPAYLRDELSTRPPFPPCVDVYHELSLDRTIIEVQTTDRIGLLYHLSRAIFDHGFDITFARIATERRIAIDTFYIEKINRTEGSDSKELLSLREKLTVIVSEDATRQAHLTG